MTDATNNDDAEQLMKFGDIELDWLQQTDAAEIETIPQGPEGTRHQT